MVIPNSGPLTFIIIRNEFAGNNPIIFTQYYRGGGIVPDTPENINIPTSGEIAVGDFYGAEGATIAVIEENTNNVDLATEFGADWAANRLKVLIVNPGVTVGANSAGGFAMTAPSGMGATLEIRNFGTILGHGGAGGPGGSIGSVGNVGTPGSPGGSGGNAGPAGNYISGNSFVTWINDGTRLGGAS